jgi:uncharacterized protein (DUF1778 family)
MQRSTYSTEFVSLTCRVTAEHAELVHRIATSQGMSAADWMRRVVLTSAADVEGVELDLTGYTSSGVINTAARALGMTAREFTAHAAREAAARVLSGQAAPARKASSQSGTRPAVRPLAKTGSR